MNNPTLNQLAIIDIETRQEFIFAYAPSAVATIQKHKLTAAMLDAIARSVARVRFAHNMALQGLVKRGLAVRVEASQFYADNPLKRVAGYVTTDNGGDNVYRLTDEGETILAELFIEQDNQP